MSRLPPEPRPPVTGTAGHRATPAEVRAWLVFLRAVEDLAEREARGTGTTYAPSPEAVLLVTALDAAAHGGPPALPGRKAGQRRTGR